LTVKSKDLDSNENLLISLFSSLKAHFLLLSLSLLGLALRLHHLGGVSLWYDELLQLDIAQGSFSRILPQLPLHSALPLDYILLHFWIKLGHQDTWVRLPATFFGTLAIPLTYQLGRVMFNRHVGQLAALLLTVHPFAVDYSQEARPYSLLLLLVLISYLGAWQAYRTHRWRYWGLAGVGLLGGSLSHYFALFGWLPLGLYVSLHQIYHWRAKLYWAHTATFALMLFILSLALLVVGRPLILYSVGVGFTTALTEPTRLTLSPTEKPNRGNGPPLEIAYISDNFLSQLATPSPLGLFIYTGCFLLATLSLIPSQATHRPAMLLLLGWLFLPCTLIYLFLLQRGTFFAHRYILYTLPAFLMLVAQGAHLAQSYLRYKLPSKSFLTSYFLYLILPLCQLSPLLTYYHLPAYEDWRAVGQLLQAEAQPNDAIITIRSEQTMNWYYPPATKPFLMYSNPANIQAEIDKHARRWFVLSSYSYKTDSELRKWLEQQGAVKLAIDKRVTLYFQQKGLSQADMLAQAKQFHLPPIPQTYAELATQFCRIKEWASCQRFYKQAIQLATTPNQQANYRAQLATWMAKSK